MRQLWRHELRRGMRRLDAPEEAYFLWDRRERAGMIKAERSRDIPVVVREALGAYKRNIGWISFDELTAGTREEMIALAGVLHQVSVEQFKALHEELTHSNFRTADQSERALRENVSVAVLYAYLLYVRRPGRLRNLALSGAQMALGTRLTPISGGLPMFWGFTNAYSAITREHDANYGRILAHLHDHALTRPQTKKDNEAYATAAAKCDHLSRNFRTCITEDDCCWLENPPRCLPARQFFI
jgi:hypothetical protein